MSNLLLFIFPLTVFCYNYSNCCVLLIYQVKSYLCAAIIVFYILSLFLLTMTFIHSYAFLSFSVFLIKFLRTTFSISCKSSLTVINSFSFGGNYLEKSIFFILGKCLGKSIFFILQGQFCQVTYSQLFSCSNLSTSSHSFQACKIAEKFTDNLRRGSQYVISFFHFTGFRIISLTFDNLFIMCYMSILLRISTLEFIEPFGCDD